MEDIIKIVKVNNIRVKNTHNGYLFPIQSILEIEFRNGEKKVLDLVSQKDITTIEYLVVEKTDKTSYKVLFEEREM